MPKMIDILFTTRLADRTLNMIEDEGGDMWWGYGHREASEFTNEVNEWLICECGVTDPDDLFAASQPVEHLWAQMSDENGERFTLVDKANDNAFPVTRLLG